MAGAALLGRLTWRVGTVVALHDETATARTITLEVPDWSGHVAGQHVDVRLTASDGYSAVRSYSIASAPNSERRVQLTVERLPDGEVSPYLTQVLAVGDRLEVRGPIGGWFVWRPEQKEPIQLIGGGSGLVPLMAMIRSRGGAGSTRPGPQIFSRLVTCAAPHRSLKVLLASLPPQATTLIRSGRSVLAPREIGNEFTY